MASTSDPTAAIAAAIPDRQLSATKASRIFSLTGFGPTS